MLTSELLARQQRHAEPRLLAVLARQLDGLLVEQPEDHRFLEQVKRCMMNELPDREPSIAVVAAKQRMSPRTLQRRLYGEGTTFAALLSDLRRDLAVRYLADARLEIGEVGFLLGFQDATAFHRAFKRWTGSTPAQHRRAALADGATASGSATRPGPRPAGKPTRASARQARL